MSYEVWGEPEDLPECTACANLAEDNAQLEKIVSNLASLVMRLSACLKASEPSHGLPERAMAYLTENNLVSSPLRETGNN